MRRQPPWTPRQSTRKRCDTADWNACKNASIPWNGNLYICTHSSKKAGARSNLQKHSPVARPLQEHRTQLERLLTCPASNQARRLPERNLATSWNGSIGVGRIVTRMLRILLDVSCLFGRVSTPYDSRVLVLDIRQRRTWTACISFSLVVWYLHRFSPVPQALP